MAADVYSGRRQLVARVLESFGAAPEPGPDALEFWLDEVVRWNRRVDLTAARDAAELVDLMVADAAMLAGRVATAARVVDVGSGAGAPGLALGLLRPDLELLLVEPKQKRAAFLRTVIGRLAQGASPAAEVRPPVARVVQARAERLGERGFDVALSRATLAPDRWLRLGAALAPQGDVWVLLAQQETPSAPGWHAAEELVYSWPLTGARRRAVRFSQAA